jgi:O-methyltransferase
VERSKSSAAVIAWRSANGVGGQIEVAMDGRPRVEFSVPGSDRGLPLAEDAGRFRLMLSVAEEVGTPSVLAPNGNNRAVDLYLDLMKKCLTRLVFKESGPPIHPDVQSFDPRIRIEGRDWPADAETMIGMYRLDNIQRCVVDILSSGVPGDLIEAGVWRGGATIFMKAILDAYGDLEKRVWVADSFEGMPLANPDKYPHDRGMEYQANFAELAVSVEVVQANFGRYGLLDERVRFLKGWFKDTLPNAPIDQLALMRLDGDLYESTWDALAALYPKLSPGGYVIVDDYNLFDACRAAVDDYRRDHRIHDPIESIDWSGVYWRRSQ